MISIAICDDELQELEHAQYLISVYLKEYQEHQITTYLFSSAFDLLSYIENEGGFDILLLDVYMPGMLGTDVAKQLREINFNGDIIFITTSKEHAVTAFEVDAAHYLVKPYKEDDFITALNKVIIKSESKEQHFIKIKTSQSIIRIHTRNITFTETGENNYQVIHTNQGENIVVRMTSSELFNLLSPNKHFIKCGASININLKYVRQVEKGTIELDSGQKIGYPYRSYKKLKEEFFKFQMPINY